MVAVPCFLYFWLLSCEETNDFVHLSETYRVTGPQNERKFVQMVSVCLTIYLNDCNNKGIKILYGLEEFKNWSRIKE